MHTERNRYLTEAMGLKPTFLMQDYKTSLDQNGKHMPDFSTYEGFGKLIEFLDSEMSDQQIADMLYALAIDGCVQNLPDKAANFTFDFLKSRESEEA